VIDMTRPHFHATISELEVLYDENKHNAKVVEPILQELKHRSSRKAKRLAKRVQNDCLPVAGHVEQRKENERPDSPPIIYDRSIVSRLVKCLKTNACAEISYKAKNGNRTQRVVSLHRFSNLNDNWYVDSWCHESNSSRSFRIDRIESVTTRSGEAESISRAQMDKELSWQARHKFRFVYADEIDLVFDFIFDASPMGTESQANNVNPSREQLAEDIEPEPKEQSRPKAPPERLDTPLARSIEEPPASFEPDDSADLGEVVGLGPKPLDKPSKFTLVRPIGGAPDAPPKKVFAKSDKVQPTLTIEAELIPRYREALDLLIKEVKRTGKGAINIVLADGKQISIDGTTTAYEFDHSGDDEVFEGAVVTANVAGTNTEGKIVSATPGRIILSFDELFGPCIGRCVLQIDNTAMLLALEKRLASLEEDSTNKFNRSLAKKVITNDDVQLIESKSRLSARESLNQSQEQAIHQALSREVSFIWGPPGTGKTQLLGELVRHLYEDGEKVLVCSNTNQAVDQLLLKLCGVLTKSHEAMQEGHVLRIGKIEHEILSERYGEFVSVEGNVERRGKQLRREKEVIEKQLIPIRKKIDKANQLLQAFVRLAAAEKFVAGLGETVQRAKQEVKGWSRKSAEIKKRLPNEKARLLVMVNERKSELAQREKAFLKFTHRSETVIRKEIRDAENALRNTLADLEVEIKQELARGSDHVAELKQSLPSQRKEFAKQQAVVSEIQQVVATHNENRLTKIIEVQQEKQKPLMGKMAEIDKKLEAIRKAVLDESKILGATVTKTYLQPETFENIDTVIVDEASMVMLPAIFHAAGLAKTRVVISGDYLQLPSIVATNEQGIFDVLGPNVFETSGIQDICETGKESDAVTLLDTQYRMESEICSLISRPFYRGRLQTGNRVATEGLPSVPSLISDKVTIIDTSAAWPYENKDAFGSRYNLMHAVVVRNLLTYLSGTDYLKSKESLGICTPYRAQSKILNSVVENQNLGDVVRASTVHRFQGDEKDTMILDIPEGLGEWYAGAFLQSDQPYESGAKLFNVAISRAKHHLVIIANLTRLDDRLPNNAILRGIINEAQEIGSVIDVNQILEMQPIEGELRRLGEELSVDSESIRNGLFRQQDFDKVFMSDIKNAKKSIAIFSGFVTTKRVGVYSDLFRQKIAEGIPIRCVTRPPHRNGTMQADGKVALQSLDDIGCVVDTRWRIHEKVVIVDDSIVWFGSLNPLSHTDSTDEIMVRLEGEATALQVAAFVALERVKDRGSAAGISVQKENPSCGDGCGARSTYRTGRYGPFWECENQCGWRANYAAHKSSASTKKTFTEAELKELTVPECPSGHGAMRLIKQSRYGPFWGCTQHPKCDETVSITI
jgi:superfamily I DNA and/or RNA helicase